MLNDRLFVYALKLSKGINNKQRLSVETVTRNIEIKLINDNIKTINAQTFRYVNNGCPTQLTYIPGMFPS